MGDRSYIAAQVHIVPDGKQEEVRAALAEYLGQEADDAPVIGEHVREEASVGTCCELALALQETGATFEVWQDPRYEISGHGHMFTPTLGAWDGEVAGDGEAVFRGGEIESLIARNATRSELVAALHRTIGTAWREELLALRPGDHTYPSRTAAARAERELVEELARAQDDRVEITAAGLAALAEVGA